MNEKPSETDKSTVGAPAKGRLRILLGLLAVALLILVIRIASAPRQFVSQLAAVFTGEDAGHVHATGFETKDGDLRMLIEQDGKRLLWGGSLDSMHFDVTESTLPLDGLHYGLGRETFPALIEPRFVDAQAASEWLAPIAHVLSVHIDGVVKVYPIDLLTRHEVVNDVVAGRPIFVAYCILANLGAVYDRRMGDQVFTFGVSGYTCAQPDVWDGRDAFVLWDRDTESLWWPTVGKAVSGPMLGAHLKLLDKPLWKQTTWGEVYSRHPNALVLDRGQNFERPESWPEYAGPLPLNDTESAAEIAPRWGENGSVPGDALDNSQ